MIKIVKDISISRKILDMVLIIRQTVMLNIL